MHTTTARARSHPRSLLGSATRAQKWCLSSARNSCSNASTFTIWSGSPLAIADIAVTSFSWRWSQGGDDVPSYNSRAYSSLKHLMRLCRILDANFPERVSKVNNLLIALIWREVDSNTCRYLSYAPPGCFRPSGAWSST